MASQWAKLASDATVGGNFACAWSNAPTTPADDSCSAKAWATCLEEPRNTGASAWAAQVGETDDDEPDQQLGIVELTIASSMQDCHTAISSIQATTTMAELTGITKNIANPLDKSTTPDEFGSCITLVQKTLDHLAAVGNIDALQNLLIRT